MKNVYCKKNLLFPLLLLLVLLPALSHAEATGSISTVPASILMGAQFNGIDLKIKGTIPAESDVIVRVTGAGDELHLREKGKIFGLLWMNVGKVTLRNVPKVCLIDSSKALDELGPVAVPYRLAGLRDAIEIEKDGNSGGIDIPHELFLLKKHEGLYNETSQGVKLGPTEGPTRTFSADLAIPSAIAPGKYQVEAIAITNGAVVGKYTTTIEAKLVGFPQWLSKMAFEKSLLYGILATLIAIFSGLAIGLVFQSKGAH
jgi:uncharacterized protein (TIGR02186 family)